MSTTHDERMRARLAALADRVVEWKKAVDRIDPACVCVLDATPGYGALNNPSCRSGRRCRGMTVLVIRTHMGMLRVGGRHLANSHIPDLVDDLADLMADLPATTDWEAFATRLAAALDTGRDPNNPRPSRTQPKEHHQP